MIFKINSKFAQILTLWRYQNVPLWQHHFTILLSDFSYLKFNFWISTFISPQLRTSSAFWPKLSFIGMRVERPACDPPYLSHTWTLCAIWIWLLNTPIFLMWMGPLSHFFSMLCPSWNCPFKFSILQHVVPVSMPPFKLLISFSLYLHNFLKPYAYFRLRKSAPWNASFLLSLLASASLNFCISSPSQWILHILLTTHITFGIRLTTVKLLHR